MAGAKEEFPPLLAPGFHRMTLSDVRRLCVDRFPYSVRRPTLMGHLESVVGLLNGVGLRGELWIDGSFCTEKLNPDDFDVVLRVLETDFQAMTADQKRAFIWFSRTPLRQKYCCDNYAFVQTADGTGQWIDAYWIRQFGFSRADEMKGMLLIPLPHVIT